jgi:hypothetical protein
MKERIIKILEDAAKSTASIVPLLIAIHFLVPGGLDVLTFEPTTSSVLFTILTIIAWGFCAAIGRDIYKLVRKQFVSDTSKA